MCQVVAGILAHVDSGKTTLSEALLYRSGELRKLGRVDHGDAFLDTDALEKERGITIFSKQARLRHNDMELTLLDTPGHVDFSAEMERTLQVLDVAILVISGTDGVQSHTKTLWRLLKRYNVPAFIFVNKMDLAGADKEKILTELKKQLDYGCEDFGAEKNEKFYESLAMCDETIMEQVLETGAADREAIRAAIGARHVFPCWFGSALRLEGVDELLDGLEEYVPKRQYGMEFGAKVYKISQDEQGTRLTHMKITGGELTVKALLSGVASDGGEWSEKVNQIRLYSGAKYRMTDKVRAGDVCAVTGLTRTRPGDGLDAEDNSIQPELEPLFSYNVRLAPGTDIHAALISLRKLEEEDPALHIDWNEQLQEIHLQLMGEVQLEILQKLLLERYGLEAGFDGGGIAYKETIESAVEGVGHYEPLRHYAEVHLLLEPGERGSGLRFATDVSEDELDRNWQRLILTHLLEKTHLGVLTGSPITDMKITLIAGRAHIKHTEGGDFRQATYRAVRHGLKCAKSILLEPWYDFRIELPSTMVGRAMTDIQQMNGSFEPPETDGELSILSGSAPVAALRGYQSELTSYSRGEGKLFCTLKGYEPCLDAENVIAEIGYDSDTDLENTADSVFCSHGAGVVVKWDKVREYMHIDTGWGKLRVSDEEPEVNYKVRAAEYGAMIAADKELMAIFERTYGPIKRDPRKTFKSVKEPHSTGAGYRAKPLPDGPEYLLVDGYNIIFAWDELKAIAEDNLDAARNQLINILCNYQGFRRCELILVFDAYKVKGNPGSVEKVHNINVVYTKEAETADMYIERVTNEIGKKHRVRVATSDGLEQLIIIGHGALRVSATEFKDEVSRAEQAIREFLSGQV
ncbi:MAG: TetM/TetW/TetO/TetS family tetracycline resistance ribosomal protection protein [Clostridiales bacterium]|nr:TetM/TetW/TetO/TetS family tetracycline resistance ribosomal protection protein [Clostridiales bacterium]